MHTANLHSIAARHGAHVLDLWGMRSVKDARMWGEDRIHLSTPGHERVAQAALTALGLPTRAGWDTPLDPAPSRPATQRRAERARWAVTYAGPWVQRRLTGRSSGDTVTAKIGEPAPFGPLDLP